MNMILFDFAECRCGHKTPIHPAMLAIAGENRKWIEIADSPVFFVCSGCKRIFELDLGNLATGSTLAGLEPYNPGAPMKRFDEELPCEVELHCTPIQVLAILKADTTAKELEAEKSTWRGRALRCPRGHVQNFPSGWE